MKNTKEEKKVFDFVIECPKKPNLDSLYERMRDDLSRINAELAKIDVELSDLCECIERRKAR